MADVLLTHGYFLSEDAHERQIMKPYPPLGILSLSAYLKRQGYAVEVLDSTFSTRDEISQKISSTPSPVIGIYGNLMTKFNVIALIETSRKAGKAVVLGGPEPASYAKEYLEAGADVVVCGEGEETLEAVLKALPSRGVHRLHHIPGVVFLDETGTLVQTDPRKPVASLDKLPWPDREAIDMDRYIRTWRDHHGRGSVSIVTARGCPYTCTWCSHAVYGFTHRRRSPSNVADEITHVIDRYAPDMLWIADDVFTISLPWLREFHSEMSRRNLRLPFECISRADRLNEESVALLHDLGCFRVWYGSESGSQRILDAMQRGVTPAEIRTAARLAHAYAIEVGLFVMLGYDGESVNDIDATVDHLQQTEADHILTTVAYPIKGTEYHKALGTHVHARADWRDRSDRDLVVSGRYAEVFYWFAQRHLVNAVRYHKLRRTSGVPHSDRAWALAKSAVARLGMNLTRFARVRT